MNAEELGMDEKFVYLTFDMDWAIDEVLAGFYKLLKELSVKATINVTHQTKYIELFRNDDNIELGIHPNYSFLLQGGAEADGVKNMRQAMGRVKEIVPEAVSCRSHALTDSSIIGALYDEFGIKYDLNKYYLPRRGVRIFPFKSPVSKAAVLPFIFEDDVYLNMDDRQDISFYLSDEFEAPRILNFHPIHLFLNTSSLKDYNAVRPYYKDYVKLKTFVNHETRGVRDIFMEAVSIAREKGYIFKMISEGTWRT